MKTLLPLLMALGLAGGLASCNYDAAFYDTASPAGTFTPYGPPTYGSPLYVSALSGAGSPHGTTFYRYGPWSQTPGRTLAYGRIPSPRGSYHYIYQDSAAPRPPVGTPMTAKTWRYTSRYPSTWGAPIWVTTYTPKASGR